MKYCNEGNINESVASLLSNEIVGKILYDSENSESLKVVSIVNAMSVKVIEYDYISETIIGDEFEFSYSKAKDCIKQ